MNPIRFIGITLITILLFLPASLSVVAATTAPSEPDKSEAPLFSPLSPTAIIENTTQALSNAPPAMRVRLLLQRGEASRAQWMYHNAYADFTTAFELAQTLSPAQPLLEITALHAIGYMQLLTQNIEEAETNLRTVVTRIESHLNADNPAVNPLAIAAMTHLGNALTALEQPAKALLMYQRALHQLATSTQINAPYWYATLHRNLAVVQPRPEDARRDLHTALAYTQTLDIPGEKARLLISIATAWQGIDPSQASDGARYHLLTQALEIGHNLQDAHLISLASGRLGALYESRNRIDDAITLTLHALSFAREVNRDDLLLQWEWQWGRLLYAQGQLKQAIAAHRRALFHIDALHQDLPFGGQEGCVSFQNSLQPVAMGLADLLLQDAAIAHDAHTQQTLLRQAQQAIETAKQSALRDYFRDPCIDAMTQPIERLSLQTAVLYPIILPDRLELLADIGGQLYRHTTPVTAADLEQIVTQYANTLRHGLLHKTHGEQLYNWIFAPFSELLNTQQVDTLVFLPDGILRMIPAAALWTGESYLAQHYAVVTAPGLTLLDPTPLPEETQRNTLLAGVSVPGPVVYELPLMMQQQLMQTNLADVDRTVRGMPLQLMQPRIIEAPAASPVAMQDMLAEYLQDILYLPGVELEIKQLGQTLPSQILLNNAFSRARFSHEMQARDYRIIHIASHGFFGGRPEENFIMAYDKLIDMNDLEAYIKPKQFAQYPVELLTLSACQTAEGDERSPLGLSGMALKSGARSVLGSLWPVSDEATQLLLSAFYRHLNTPGTTKAAALKQAQQELIQHPQLNHPFFWSAFILSGNWL